MNQIKITTTLLSITLLLLLVAAGSAFAEEPASGLEWEIVQEMTLPRQPLQMVHSLDGKLLFILTENNGVLVYDTQGELQGTIPIEEGVTNIDITPRGEVVFLLNEKKKKYTAVAVSFIKDINISGSPFLGLENAPVVLVVFTDFQCPYCAKIVPILEKVLENNPDTVKIVLKNLPLTSIHKFAQHAALAALAAGEQGKFWQFHDELFSTPKLNDKVIDSIATELKLDMDQFKKDMASDKLRAKLDRDTQDADKANVGGTPSLFINGRQVKSKSLAAIQKMIDQELEKKKSGK